MTTAGVAPYEFSADRNADEGGNTDTAGFTLVVVYLAFALMIGVIGRALTRFFSQRLGYNEAVARLRMRMFFFSGESQADTGKDMTDPRIGRSTILEYFKTSGNQLNLTEGNLVSKNHDASSENGDIEAAGEDGGLTLVFPQGHPRSTTEEAELGNDEGNTTTSRILSTSGTCTICLSNYCEGETIVWSHDKACMHMYHRECFVDYLTMARVGEPNSCPMCRRSFCSESIFLDSTNKDDGGASTASDSEDDATNDSSSTASSPDQEREQG